MARRRGTVALLLLILSLLPLGARPVAASGTAPEPLLVSGGRARAAILWWSAEPSPVPAFAAAELRRYLREISGAAAPVVRVEQAAVGPIPGAPSALLVLAGDEASAYLRREPGAAQGVPASAAAAGGRLPAMREDGYVVRSTGGRAVLAGNTHRGTLYAAYHLLEELGVRFEAPEFRFYGGNAEIVPSRSSVELPVLDIAEQPDFRLRRSYVEEGWSHTPETVRQLIAWMAKRRLNVLVYPYDYEGRGVVRWDEWRDVLLPKAEERGILIEVGGHGYQSFLPPSEYGRRRPEWFPPGYTVFDVSRPEAVRTYAENVAAYLRERPEIAIFDAWPPDRASWPPEAVRRFGSIANAQAHVTRELEAVVRRRAPGVRVEAPAFVPAAYPPTPGAMYSAETIVDLAPYDRSYAAPIGSGTPPINALYAGRIARWRTAGFRGEMGVQEYFRKYSWRSLPVVLPRLIAEDVRFYRDQGAEGMGTYSEPADWLTYELSHLLVAALSWDADLDAEAFVSTYLRERYGAAAPEVGRYVEVVEEAGRLLFDRPAGNYGDPRTVARARDLYAEAGRSLVRARYGVAGGGAPAFLIERLAYNAEYALADAVAALARLEGDPSALAAAEDRVVRLLEAHRFDGVLLLSPWSARPYAARLGPAAPRRLYAAYRRRWSSGTPPPIGSGARAAARALAPVQLTVP